MQEKFRFFVGLLAEEAAGQQPAGAALAGGRRSRTRICTDWADGRGLESGTVTERGGKLSHGVGSALICENPSNPRSSAFHSVFSPDSGESERLVAEKDFWGVS